MSHHQEVELPSLALVAAESVRVLQHGPLNHTCITEINGGIGMFKSTMNLILATVGAGVLALPVAIGQSGYGIGVLLVLLPWALTHAMMHLLFLCIQSIRLSGGTSISYVSMGELAYGKAGRMVVATCSYTYLFSMCTILIQLAGTNLSQLTVTLSIRLWILISGLCIMLPFGLLPSMKEVGVLSFIGAIAVIAICVIVLIVVSVLPPSERGSTQPTPISFSGLVSGFLQFMNAYMVAPMVPSIIVAMKHLPSFPLVSTIAFTAVAAVCSIISFGGYIAFGKDILRYGLFTVGMTEKSAAIGSTAYASVCQFASIIVCLANFLIGFNTIAQASDSLVEKKVSVANRRRGTVFKALTRISLVVFMMIIAIFVPGFIFAVDLVSATVVLPMQVIAPILLYARICSADIQRMPRNRRYILLSAFTVTVFLCPVAMAAGLYVEPLETALMLLLCIK
jgi:amino acid permease